MRFSRRRLRCAATLCAALFHIASVRDLNGATHEVDSKHPTLLALGEAFAAPVRRSPPVEAIDADEIERFLPPLVVRLRTRPAPGMGLPRPTSFEPEHNTLRTSALAVPERVERAVLELPVVEPAPSRLPSLESLQPVLPVNPLRNISGDSGNPLR